MYIFNYTDMNGKQLSKNVVQLTLTTTLNFLRKQMHEIGCTREQNNINFLFCIYQ